MDREKLFNVLLKGLNINKPDVTENTRLKDLKLDSISMLGVLAMLDHNCSVKISTRSLRSCKKIKDILNLAFPN